jgi:hypothetical protein
LRASISYQTIYSAYYFEEDFKVTSRLTLNIAIRDDYETPRTERYNRLSYFDFDAVNPAGRDIAMPDLRGGLKFVTVDGNPRGWNDPDRNNFAPPFGFAYQRSRRL